MITSVASICTRIRSVVHGRVCSVLTQGLDIHTHEYSVEGFPKMWTNELMIYLPIRFLMFWRQRSSWIELVVSSANSRIWWSTTKTMKKIHSLLSVYWISLLSYQILAWCLNLSLFCFQLVGHIWPWKLGNVKVNFASCCLWRDISTMYIWAKIQS